MPGRRRERVFRERENMKVIIGSIFADGNGKSGRGK
jgi:hypothetical protein